ncbi:Lrp/AsnC family transcriptional regulator [Kocuria marina]|uniref:Lrp/AsnC family transcriptional regulator n=1 Tax=Kocuria marina TaxID=223184 RepID=UPI001642FFE9|nr:Lrp/AsnC ligand binding domain-containing protein [Kocuria indica]
MLSNGHIKSELSPQDQELISLLQWAPRITWGEAAEILGAHATTLAGRWEKLERSGIAWITAQVNLSDTRNQLSFIEISCNPGGWAHVADTFTAMPEVISVEAFAPSPDLGLTVLSHDLESLSRFVEEQISQVPGVAKVQLMLSSRLHRAGDKWRLDQLSDEQRAAAQAWTSAEQAALPTSTTALGEVQRPVIEALMRDGRASAAEIARSTGLHPATARRYLQKVLASGLLSIRCDLVQGLSSSPVTAQWFMRLNAYRHEDAAEALAKDPRTRVVSSITGRSNMMVVMWLSSVGEIIEAEQAIQSLVSDVEIQESVISLRPLKRMGWVLENERNATRTFVAPHLHLS